jgi:uncharacterized phage-associated protein
VSDGGVTLKYMNIEKLVQATGYILRKYDNGRLNYTKLIKELYLADKDSLRAANQTITGDTYASMKNGPVLSGLYNLIKGRHNDTRAQIFWDSRFSTDGCDLVAVVNRIPEGKLSRFEKQALDDIDDKFHSKNYGQMIDYVHDPVICPEWKDPGLSSIPIKIDELLASIGRTQEEIEWVLKENEDFEEEEKIFASLEA